MKSHLSGFPVFGPDAAPTQVRLFELYHENSKLRPGITPPPPEAYPVPGSKPRSLRPIRYPNSPVVPLPAPDAASLISLSWPSLISKRRTCRRFKTRALPLSSVAAILYSAYGISEPVPGAADNSLIHRASPSAGATFPLEVYAVLNHSNTPPPGLYHYSPGNHAFSQISPLDPSHSLDRMCLDGPNISSAPLILIITAVFSRTTTKYGDRGYRYVLLEAGHVAQTIALTAASLELATFPIGGFIDDKINTWIGLDGVNEAACYMIGIGEPDT